MPLCRPAMAFASMRTNIPLINTWIVRARYDIERAKYGQRFVRVSHDRENAHPDHIRRYQEANPRETAIPQFTRDFYSDGFGVLHVQGAGKERCIYVGYFED